MGLSIASYFATVSFITSFILLDFNFYQVWNRLLGNGSFWLTVILITMLVTAKDIYISGLERNFNFKPWHIIQEVMLVFIVYFTIYFCPVIKINCLVCVQMEMNGAMDALEVEAEPDASKGAGAETSAGAGPGTVHIEIAKVPDASGSVAPQSQAQGGFLI
jgi:hypothetical protein